MPENDDRSSRLHRKLRQAGAWAGAAAVYAAAQGLSAWAAQRQSGRGTRPQYSQFERPAFAPPGAVFPVVWSALNLTTATSAWRIWRAPRARGSGTVPRRGPGLVGRCRRHPQRLRAAGLRPPSPVGGHGRCRAPVRGHGALWPAGPPDRPARGAAGGSRGRLDGVCHGAQHHGCRAQTTPVSARPAATATAAIQRRLPYAPVPRITLPPRTALPTPGVRDRFRPKPSES